MEKELYRESILQDQYGLSIKNIPSVPCLPTESSLCSAKHSSNSSSAAVKFATASLKVAQLFGLQTEVKICGS